MHPHGAPAAAYGAPDAADYATFQFGDEDGEAGAAAMMMVSGGSRSRRGRPGRGGGGGGGMVGVGPSGPALNADLGFPDFGSDLFDLAADVEGPRVVAG